MGEDGSRPFGADERAPLLTERTQLAGPMHAPRIFWKGKRNMAILIFATIIVYAVVSSEPVMEGVE